MNHILPVDKNHSDSNISKTLQAVEKKLGVLPNLFTTLAHSYPALSSYIQLTELAGKGRLTAKQRESIAIAIAQENKCEYCLSAHSAIGQSVGLNVDDVEMARRAYSPKETDRLIVSFAQSLVRHAGKLTDEEIKVVVSRLGPELVMEIITHVATNIFTNYVNLVAGTEIDFPLVSIEQAS